MSTIIQPTFDIPPDILEGLIAGTLKRVGSVVYHAAGTGKTGIVKHLKEVTPTQETQSALPIEGTQSVLSKIADFLKTSQGKTTVAIGIGIVVAGGVAFWLMGKAKKKKQSELLSHVENYNKSLCAYLDAINNKKLDANIINSLIANLDAMQENHDGGKVTIDFSSEQFETLSKLICDYTEKLAEVNSVDMQEAISITSDNPFSGLKHYLEIQKQIFESAA